MTRGAFGPTAAGQGGGKECDSSHRAEKVKEVLDRYGATAWKRGGKPKVMVMSFSTFNNHKALVYNKVIVRDEAARVFTSSWASQRKPRVLCIHSLALIPSSFCPGH